MYLRRKPMTPVITNIPPMLMTPHSRLAGMDWIIQNVQAFERPSVVNMSWGLYEPTPNLVSLDLAIAVVIRLFVVRRSASH